MREDGENKLANLSRKVPEVLSAPVAVGKRSPLVEGVNIRAF